MRRHDLASDLRGAELRLTLINALIADQEHYLAQLQLRKGRLAADIQVVRLQMNAKAKSRAAS